MALSKAWSIGLSGLSTSTDRISLVSRNVARAGDVNASRKVGEQTTLLGGGVRMASVIRVADKALLEGSMRAGSDVAKEGAIATALDQLKSTIADPELQQSPAALVGALEARLRTYALDPTSLAAGRQVVSAADDIVRALQGATQTVTEIRTGADIDIANAVQRLNDNLGRLEALNQIIVQAPASEDVTDQLDERDAVLRSISEDIGIRVLSRGGNDISVYTDGGVTLFETVARRATFTSSAPIGPGGSGANVLIDGVDVTGPTAHMPLRSGAIAGLVTVRDEIGVAFQAQIDEIARGLIETFADSDQSGGPKPDLPGLFTWSAGTVPLPGTIVNGLAAMIRVNPAVDPAQGGDLRYLRDGGASAPADPDYNANPAGNAGFSGRVQQLIGALGAVRAFDAGAGLGTTSSIREYASLSVGWLDQERQVAQGRLEVRTAVRDRAIEGLLSVTGVNLDQEMADLLTFERTFQASSQLIKVIDELFTTLIASTR